MLFNKDAGEPKPFHFRIDQLAGSLVLSPLTRTAHMLLVKQKDVLAPTNVATALNALNATYGMKISTETLVEALVMKGDPKRAERKEEITRGLKRLSKAELAPYCEGAGDELWWFIPGAAADQG